MSEIVGVVIDSGPSDWQILQQDARGRVNIPLSGRWAHTSKPQEVLVRLVHEDTGVPPAKHLDWSAGRMNDDGTWQAQLKNVPAGGLYRIETALHLPNSPIEWSFRGDMRHFVGVGDLWVIAGQSNSTGYGKGPVNDGPRLGVHLFNNAMRWTLASHPLNDSTDTAHPANREGGNSGHSHWLAWAGLVKEAMGFPIGLVQVSLGGSPLVSWNPAEKGEHPLYDTMVRCVEAVGGRVKGVLWYQGCSDTGTTEAADSYKKRFIAAVRAWRKVTKNPAMRVVTVQINRVYWPPDAAGQYGWTAVREAQRQVARELTGAIVVPTLDLPLSDGIHTSPYGNLQLAQRCANAALGAFYGQDVDWQAPEPVRARRLSGGKIVEIEFAHVSGRMDSIDVTAIPFRVEDAQGAVEVTKVQYTLGPRVRLHLARALGVKAVVHGGYGFNPPIVPMDAPRMMPMLGFAGLAVE